MDRTANAGTAFKWSVGSNPTLSAMTGRWFNRRPVAAPQYCIPVTPMLHLCDGRSRQELLNSFRVRGGTPER
jgi:hypothetical protein